MTAARLQRYALFLSGLNYNIEFRSTSRHFNCDFLSRLPLNTTADPDSGGSHVADDDVDVFAIDQLDTAPVTSAAIQRETRNDRLLSLVFQYSMHGWPSSISADLRPYFQRRDDLSIHQGCLMWGGRVIVPDKLRSRPIT